MCDGTTKIIQLSHTRRECPRFYLRTSYEPSPPTRIESESAPLKLACIIPTLNGGGAERVMARLCSELSRRNHTVTLITLDNGKQDRHAVDPAVQRVHLDAMSNAQIVKARFGSPRRLMDAVRRISSLRQAIKNASPDAILSFCDQMNVMTLIAATRTKIPTVVCERSDPRHQVLPKIWEQLRVAMYPKASSVVALSDEVADHLIHYYQSRTEVIPSAIDPPAAQSNRAIAATAQQILAVGRLEPEKGFERLLHAFAKISPQYPQWTLCIAGDGSLRSRLEQLIDELNLQNHVHLPGWIQNPWEEKSDTTLFVLPSLYEGFPSALMEAMSRGVPSICVDCDSGPRAILDAIPEQTPHPAALLVTNDLNGIETGLEKMMSDPTLREAIGKKGTDITSVFSWTNVVDRYEQLLVQACS